MAKKTKQPQGAQRPEGSAVPADQEVSSPGNAAEQKPPEGKEQKKAKKRTGRKRGTEDQFTGRAGQLAVMAELLDRGCNAAIPEVDLGSDIFAFKEDRAEVVRIQVKTNAKQTVYKDRTGYSAKFAIPMKQLNYPDDNRPPLFYALAVRREKKEWIDFLVISRATLKEHWNGARKFGHENGQTGDLEITVEFRNEVICSGCNLTEHRNAWHALPPLRPLPNLSLAEAAQAEAMPEAQGPPASGEPKPS
jgi:hypothetical protein